MKKPKIGMLGFLVAILLMLLGCSPYEHEHISIERFRELIAQANVANATNATIADVSTTSLQYKQNKNPSTQSTEYEKNTSEKTAEPYDRDYLGYVPDSYYGDLTDAEKRGLQTWYFWTGGNEKFFRDLAKQTYGENDFLSLLDARSDSALLGGDTHHVQRNERFKVIGAINDPGCKQATEPDEHGLWFDKCDKDPQAAGIMGARKFPNPNFDPQKWDVAKYYAVGEERAQVEPPYRIGISCGICHIAYNPLKPPADLENPKWDNLASAIGNQYLREGALFGGNLPPLDFRRQVLDSQPPGTSDTSRIATDHINNPNAINAIFNLEDRLNLANQPGHEQVMNDGTTKGVPNVLKDGADSVGVALASERVYINIGSCSDYWLTLHDPLLGRKPQKPFDIETARKKCEYWPKTEARMADAEAFLKTLTPMHLEDAPGGKAYLTKDKAVLDRGKIVFADTCATCHSSKQPPAQIAANPEQAKEWYRQSVLSSDFLDHNFLSDDLRKPVTLIGTNASRALATNAAKGHVWEQFSSKTYKELPSPGTLKLENPFDKDKAIAFEVPSGGTGYYRTPSLISLWSSAPFFHNNMLGKYNADPSVEGRMEAFNDAIQKLLWPQKREGTILRTERNSYLEVGKLKAAVPKGTPINLLANLNPSNTPEILQRKLNSDVGAKVLQALVNFAPDKVITPLLLKNNESPDFIEDHGHYFGTDLSDEDKRALIEFLKTF
jgi:cytochrome c5